jgi:hypothetical protein
MSEYLICHRLYKLPNLQGWSRNVDVIDSEGEQPAKYQSLCWQLSCDIQTAEGSGAIAMEGIRLVESGECQSRDEGGNGWIVRIERDKVSFVNIWSGDLEGEVTFQQYKTAVSTFVRFLSNPAQTVLTALLPDD